MQSNTDLGYQGLDLATLDATTTAEWTAWRAADYATRGFALPAYDFWLEFRADVVKRLTYLRPLINDQLSTLCYLEYYAIVGFEEGVLYCIDGAERQGIGRDTVLDALAIAALYSPTMGLHRMAPQLRQRIYDLRLRAETFAWPDNWESDRAVWSCGLDYSSRAATDAEVQAVRQWYASLTGEVPRFVEFLADFHPDLLKGYRNRLENVVRTCPNQFVPYSLIVLEGLRGQPDGIRDAVLLARGLGMTRQQAIAALVQPSRYGGVGVLSMIDVAVGPILRAW